MADEGVDLAGRTSMSTSSSALVPGKVFDNDSTRRMERAAGGVLLERCSSRAGSVGSGAPASGMGWPPLALACPNRYTVSHNGPATQTH